MSGEGEEVESAAISTGPKEKWNHVRVAYGVELHLSADLPKFKLAGLRRVLELLESLAVTEPQKIAPPHRKPSERGPAPGSEGSGA